MGAAVPEAGCCWVPCCCALGRPVVASGIPADPHTPKQSISGAVPGHTPRQGTCDYWARPQQASKRRVHEKWTAAGRRRGPRDDPGYCSQAEDPMAAQVHCGCQSLESFRTMY